MNRGLQTAARLEGRDDPLPSGHPLVVTRRNNTIRLPKVSAEGDDQAHFDGVVPSKK